MTTWTTLPPYLRIWLILLTVGVALGLVLDLIDLFTG